jgi:outer membrane protein OmpA-like peptidoglycan-associated protein
MSRKLTPLGRTLIVASGLSLMAYGAHSYGLLDRLVPARAARESKVPLRAELPAAADPGLQSTTALRLPGDGTGCSDKPEVRMLVWAWNAQMGALYANGGAQSTTGSLMCEHGVNLKLVRQDDVARMQEDLVAFASALSRGEREPAAGAPLVSIMGDGSAAFLQGVDGLLGKLGPEYRARVVGSLGYSRGEDKFMGPQSWKDSPQSSRGGVVAGVLRDGDWNIAQKWLGDNGLCNNPDERSYDPDCLNWISATTYVDAAEKYVAGYCEQRPVVHQGRRSGETRKVCTEGVVTWTPGDVIVAEKRGGLVSIVSTREYSSQMPNVVIGVDRWLRDHRTTVEGLLEAAFDGADQVRSHPEALRKGAQISAIVYAEPGADATYWQTYFDVVRRADRRGRSVELGGSSVNGLADNLVLFGLAPGSPSLFAATYTAFGDVVVAQYPDLVPSYPRVEDVVDASYLKAIAARRSPRLPEPAPVPASTRLESVLSRRAWNIAFETGQATFTPAARSELSQLLRDLLVAGNTVVEVHGHTDSMGSRDANQSLSEARAFAVKAYLEGEAPRSFPQGRIRIFAHGQENPVAPNGTAEGRARNRRVEIVLGIAG